MISAFKRPKQGNWFPGKADFYQPDRIFQAWEAKNAWKTRITGFQTANLILFYPLSYTWFSPLLVWALVKREGLQSRTLPNESW